MWLQATKFDIYFNTEFCFSYNERENCKNLFTTAVLVYKDT